MVLVQSIVYLYADYEVTLILISLTPILPPSIGGFRHL